MAGLGRRKVLKVFGGAAVAWPVTARAQQPQIPVVGFLSAGSPGVSDYIAAAFRQGLADGGYVEGRNVRIEYRWAEGHYDRLSRLADELVRRPVAAIAVPETTAAALAAKAATKSIPIIFGTGGDPVQLGLVTSFNRPGGNLTGVTRISAELTPKRLELLHEVVPTVSVIGLLVNPSNPSAGTQVREGQEAAGRLKVQLLVLRALSASDIDAAFAAIAKDKIGALLVANDLFFTTQREHLAALAARYAIPAMYSYPEYAAAGGLLCYSASMANSVREVGAYTARVLRGEKPSELPVVQSTKFELIINLKTAKALGLEIPAKVLALADEVIE